MAGSEAAVPSTGGGEVSLKDQGNEYFKAGNFLKAAAIYTQAIKQDPKNATLYRLISFFFPLCSFFFPFLPSIFYTFW